MALQQAQLLLSMNSLDSVNAGVQQNNTESFAVALGHLAELHAEQVGRWPGPVLLEPCRPRHFCPLVLEKSTGWVCLDASGWKGEIPPVEMDWVWSLQGLLNLGSLLASGKRVRGQLFLCTKWNKKESLKFRVVELCMFVGKGRT